MIKIIKNKIKSCWANIFNRKDERIIRCKRPFLHPTSFLKDHKFLIMIMIIPVIIYYLPLIADTFTTFSNGGETIDIQIREIGNIKGQLPKTSSKNIIGSYFVNNKPNLFFIDNNSMVVDLETGIIKNIPVLKNNNVISLSFDKLNNLIIVNKKINENKTYIDFSKFNNSLLKYEKPHLNFEIDKNAIVDVCNLDNSDLNFRVVVPNQSNNFILTVNKDDFTISKSPYNTAISGGDTHSVMYYGTYLIGGYNNITKSKSNDIFFTPDNFKTLEKKASIDKNVEIIKSYWVLYPGEYASLASVPEQEIFIFGKDTTNGELVCYKFNTYQKHKFKVKKIKLDKNIKNSEIEAVLQVGDYETVVFREENKYYFSLIKYKSSLKKIDYLFEDDCEKIYFAKRPPYYSDNKILIIGSKNQNNSCSAIKEMSF